MTFFRNDYSDDSDRVGRIGDHTKTSSPFDHLNITDLFKANVSCEVIGDAPTLVPNSYLPDVMLITDSSSCADGREPLKNITLTQDNFKLLGPEAKEILDFLSIDSVSVFSNEGKTYVSLEFKKNSFDKKNVELVPGVAMSITDPGDGSRQLVLHGDVGSIRLNRKVTAEVVKNDKEIQCLKQIKGIQGQIPTKVGSVNFTVSSISVAENDGKTTRLEIQGETVVQTRTTSINIPSDQLAKLNALVTDVDKLRSNPPPEIISTQSPEELLSSENEFPSWDDAKRLGLVLGMLLLAKKLRDLNRATIPPPETSPERLVIETAVDDKVSKPGSKLSIDKYGTVSDFVDTKDSPGTIYHDKSGRIFLIPTNNETQIFVKGRDGKIQRHTNVPPEGIEILPGESFHLCNYRDPKSATYAIDSSTFIQISQKKIAPIAATFSQPGGLYLKVGFQQGDSIEIGSGNSKGLISSNSATARVELGTKISEYQARFAVDEGGVYIRDGETTKNGENISSKDGTWVNGERLKPGDKRYLKAGDKVSFGEPGKPNSVRVCIDPISDRPGTVSPTLASECMTPRVVRTVRSDSGKGRAFELVPNQDLIIGPNTIWMSEVKRKVAPPH